MHLSPYEHLEKRFKRIHTLKTIIHLLRWDAEVMMPQGSADLRAAQLSLLDTETNSILRSKKTEKLLNLVESSSGALNEWEKANLREIKRIWLRANAIPKRLIRSLHFATTKGEMCWRKAREENNFKPLAPHLERIIDLLREKAQCLSGKLGIPPYDTLIDEHDPGGRSGEIDKIFQVLEIRLPALIEEIIEFQERHTSRSITEPISVKKQKSFGKWVMERVGFPFHFGRLDESLHPFTEGTAEDIRITSCFSEKDFLSGLMGVLHETGHALYDQGLPSEWSFQPAGRDRGMCIHESLALFLEMLIGRTKEFMIFCNPALLKIFEVSGPAWKPDNLFRMATQVKKDFLRMNADEATYPMHIIIRYELEKSLISGLLRVRDLPEAWNERFKLKFGIFPDSLSDGCLQDSHWPQGYFGYFSTYCLGLIIATQFFSALKKELPNVMEEVQAGQFENLMNWLNDRIFKQGARFTRNELITRATGEELNPLFYLDYLQKKYLDTN